MRKAEEFIESRRLKALAFLLLVVHSSELSELLEACSKCEKVMLI